MTSPIITMAILVGRAVVRRWLDRSGLPSEMSGRGFLGLAFMIAVGVGAACLIVITLVHPSFSGAAANLVLGVSAQVAYGSASLLVAVLVVNGLTDRSIMAMLPLPISGRAVAGLVGLPSVMMGSGGILIILIPSTLAAARWMGVPWQSVAIPVGFASVMGSWAGVLIAVAVIRISSVQRRIAGSTPLLVWVGWLVLMGYHIWRSRASGGLPSGWFDIAILGWPTTVQTDFGTSLIDLLVIVTHGTVLLWVAWQLAHNLRFAYLAGSRVRFKWQPTGPFALVRLELYRSFRSTELLATLFGSWFVAASILVFIYLAPAPEREQMVNVFALPVAGSLAFVSAMTRGMSHPKRPYQLIAGIGVLNWTASVLATSAILVLVPTGVWIALYIVFIGTGAFVGIALLGGQTAFIFGVGCALGFRLLPSAGNAFGEVTIIVLLLVSVLVTGQIVAETGITATVGAAIAYAAIGISVLAVPPVTEWRRWTRVTVGRVGRRSIDHE